MDSAGGQSELAPQLLPRPSRSTPHPPRPAPRPPYHAPFPFRPALRPPSSAPYPHRPAASWPRPFPLPRPAASEPRPFPAPPRGRLAPPPARSGPSPQAHAAPGLPEVRPELAPRAEVSAQTGRARPRSPGIGPGAARVRAGSAGPREGGGAGGRAPGAGSARAGMRLRGDTATRRARGRGGGSERTPGGGGTPARLSVLQPVGPSGLSIHVPGLGPKTGPCFVFPHRLEMDLGQREPRRADGRGCPRCCRSGGRSVEDTW